jgi:hypothetical protein
MKRKIEAIMTYPTWMGFKIVGAPTNHWRFFYKKLICLGYWAIAIKKI